jgi:glycosyltransferase involved in cell wall biosynthesis
MEDLKFSILIPTYKGALIISDTLKSILTQSYKNFEVIISEDGSNDNIEDVILSFDDKRISFYRNEKNLGYGKNLEVARKKACGDIIYLMGQDDILAKDAFLKTYNAFKISDDIGAVTRPYYWFNDDINLPVRDEYPLNFNEDEIVYINSDFTKIKRVLASIGQLSGLALRSKYIESAVHEDIFPAHVYPFMSVFKKHPIVFLKSYILAVRINSSQTRHVSWIYDKSPILSWVEMYQKLFPEKEFDEFRDKCIKEFICKNYLGLVQIRNYSKYMNVFREIYFLFKYRKLNLLSFNFWFFGLGTLIIPPFILIPLVDWYKNKINSKLIRKINFEMDI